MKKNNETIVSVIVPTYNRAGLIGRAVKIVLKQTYADLEVIVVDDGSTDNTEEIVKDIRDERVRYIKHSHNRGLSSARNTGIREACGRYIAFQDDDDIWMPGKLEKQMSLFRDAPPEVGVVYGSTLRIFEGKKVHVPSRGLQPKEGDLYGILLKSNFISIVSAVVKRECFEKAGMFDESLPNLEDWDLWLRVSKYYHFRYLDEAVATVYFTRQSITADNSSFIKAMELILDRHQDDYEKHKKELSNQYMRLGHRHCICGRGDAGRKHFLKAFTAYPLNVKSLLTFLLSFAGSAVYRRAYGLFTGARMVMDLF
ncbi:MAG: glycosyltransferase [Candidatus Omnitrophota bacterium]|nr:glycosyltransferase [Candidatus Omnitrophota bacterium]